MNEILKEYIKLSNELKENDEKMIPLCAAQTHISNFCKQPLLSNFEGKYSFVDNDLQNSFVDGKYVEELNRLLTEECHHLFNASYINADTLTGINCFTVCAMILLKKSAKVLVTTPEQGGHASIPVILQTLGIKYDTIPYNYSEYQIDYVQINKLLKKENYSFLIFCQSDIINPPDLYKIELPATTGIIYDGTQTLGLIAGKKICNPLNVENLVLIGGTHKTLPAPACGLIMTNNKEYIKLLKEKITPHFLRNTQPNHIASLLLSLIEQEEYGVLYQEKTVSTANLLGSKLENLGFHLAKLDSNLYSYTHQLFILMSRIEADRFYYNAQKYNISLNQKNKKLFNDNGIRLGTQQIARYNWSENEISKLAELLHLTFLGEHYHEEILELRRWLIAKKTPHFECEEIAIK